jgi:hypothetical protein
LAEEKILIILMDEAAVSESCSCTLALGLTHTPALGSLLGGQIQQDKNWVATDEIVCSLRNEIQGDEENPQQNRSTGDNELTCSGRSCCFPLVDPTTLMRSAHFDPRHNDRPRSVEFLLLSLSNGGSGQAKKADDGAN